MQNSIAKFKVQLVCQLLKPSPEGSEINRKPFAVQKFRVKEREVCLLSLGNAIGLIAMQSSSFSWQIEKTKYPRIQLRI